MRSVLYKSFLINVNCFKDDGNKKITGRDIVYENLRQICIHRTLEKKFWWDYMINFKEICISDNTQTIKSTTCYQSVFKKVNIDEVLIKKCIDDSFVGPDPLSSDNKILNGERQLFL